MMAEEVHRWQDMDGRAASPVAFEQGNGEKPESSLAMRWAGSKGFHLSRHHFVGGAHMHVVPADHLIAVQPQRVDRMKCRIGDFQKDHSPLEWNIAICPAGVPAEAESDDDVDVVLLSIPVDTFAFASAQSSRQTPELGGRINERDARLAAVVRLAVKHANAGDPFGPLWWDLATDALVDHLLERYCQVAMITEKSVLGRHELKLIRDFVNENIGGPLNVEAIAEAVGLTRSHFTRMFTKATGLTPHRYVMRTRLQVAHRLLRKGDCAPAAAAAEAGFVDQSHLAAWTRRMFAGTVGQMRANFTR